MRHLLLVPLTLCCASVATGQQPAAEPAATTSARTSALTITTNDPALAAQVAAAFESSAPMPAFGDGQGAVLSLDDGGKLVAQATETSGWLRIDARPAALMELFAEQIAQQRMMLQMIAGMSLAESGIEPATFNDLVTAVVSFPEQIDALVVVMPQAYREGEPTTIDLDLTPKASTWLATLVGNLQQAPGGGASVPSAADTVARIDVSVDFAKILPQLQPLIGTLASLRDGDEESQTKIAGHVRGYLAGFTGAISMVLGEDLGSRTASMLTDPVKMTALIADPEFHAAMRAYGDLTGQGEGGSKFELAAVSHRDVSIDRHLSEVDPGGSDVMTFESFTAITGGLLLTTSQDSGARHVKALVDLALDQKLERQSFSAGQLLRGTLMVPKLLEALSNVGMAPADPTRGHTPAAVDFVVAKTPSGLNVKVNLE